MSQLKYRMRACLAVIAAAACMAGAASAQAPSPSAAPTAPTPTTGSSLKPAGNSLDQLAWLRGCWAGKVAQFDFVESWLNARGGMMVGINQTIVPDRNKPNTNKTQEFQYLRLEERPDGVYYVAIPSGKKETTFRLVSTGEELGHTAYVFKNSVDEFPQEIVYMRGKEGWLYAKVSGKTANHPHPTEVTYPMQHVDCLTGALLSQ